MTYAGPDQTAAGVSGGCTDNAGNFTPAPVSINYDATAPVLSKPSVDSRDGSNLVRWTSSSPSDTAVVQRWPRGGKAAAGRVPRGRRRLHGREGRGRARVHLRRADGRPGGQRVETRLVAPGWRRCVTLRQDRRTCRALPTSRSSAGPRPRGAATTTSSSTAGRSGSSRRGRSRISSVCRRRGVGGKWRHRLRAATAGTSGRASAARSFARYRTLGSAQFIVPPR